jgi:TRAP-type uncharacterized transport system substrate-binding protein
MRISALTAVVSLLALLPAGRVEAQASVDNIRHRHVHSAKLGERPMAALLEKDKSTHRPGASTAVKKPAEAGTPDETAAPAPNHLNSSTAANAGAIGVMSEGASDHYIRMIADLTSVFEGTPNLRIVGIIGKGTVQNLRDLRYLRGVDVSVMHSDALDIAKRLGEGDVSKTVSYIARLQNEEMHIIARNDITDIRQLAGKKVNVSLAGSGVAASSGNVFSHLGIDAQLVNFPERLAEDKLKSGEIDAAVFWDPIPDITVRTFKNDGQFHLLAVPYEDSLQSIYYPASIPADTYPGMVPPGQKLETVSLNAIVAAYSWPQGSERYQRVSRFAQTFLSKFGDLQKQGRDSIWQSIDPVGVAQGWQRFPAAQQWIDANITHATAAANPDPSVAEFQTFLKENPNRTGVPNADAAAKLFEEFINWRKAKAKTP